MTALVIIFSFTPIGSIPIGPLVITLNIIPVAIAAGTCGPIGGAIIGGVFGLFSFLQCLGIGIPSGMGQILLEINPFLAFAQRFFPRLLDGFIVGYIFQLLNKKTNITVTSGITGFCSAFFNTLLFMSTLILFFGNTDYVQKLQGGKNVFLFVITFVGVNALVEMITATIITAAVGTALYRSKLLPEWKKNTAKA